MGKTMREITVSEARRFLLCRQGLMGSRRFEGAAGALAYVRQAGCLQFDPVDLCGRNAELTLQARVRRFRKDTLHSLLYRDRALFDYADKELAIIPVEDWPCFAPYRECSKALGATFPELAELETQALAWIRENGPASSDTLPVDGSISWHSSMHWSGSWEGKTRAARAVLEQLYTDGTLVIHHKNGTRKFYDLAERHIDPAVLEQENPFADEQAWRCWRVRRRIGAVGLLWNRRSDAFLGIDMDSAQREEAFRRLLEAGSIREIRVAGIRYPLCFPAEDEPLLDAVCEGTADTRMRMEFLAPLDPLLWDRKLIEALWDFRYSWEIYTPPAKRKYGAYVLPILWGERFVGRIEMVTDARRGELDVRRVWYEDGVRETQALRTALGHALRRFAAFSACGTILRNDRSTPQAVPACPE